MPPTGLAGVRSRRSTGYFFLILRTRNANPFWAASRISKRSRWQCRNRKHRVIDIPVGTKSGRVSGNFTNRSSHFKTTWRPSSRSSTIEAGAQKDENGQPVAAERRSLAAGRDGFRMKRASEVAIQRSSGDQLVISPIRDGLLNRFCG